MAQGSEERVTLALWPDEGAQCRSQLAGGKGAQVECTHDRDLQAPLRERVPVLAAYDAGVEAISELAARFDEDSWATQTPCPEWRAFELAGHLRCVADDFHEYLDEAPVSRYARLMATGAHPETIGRKLARQNAAELAALGDAPPADHIAAFVESARRYADRLVLVWHLPHHQYRDAMVSVAGMAGAACAEWHLHAWDLARSLGVNYRPADPDAVLEGWRAGMPHLPAPPVRHGTDPWHAVLAASGRYAFGWEPVPRRVRVLGRLRRPRKG
jgi:uncharacterized protein (TIGR03083 family)